MAISQDKKHSQLVQTVMEKVLKKTFSKLYRTESYKQTSSIYTFLFHKGIHLEESLLSTKKTCASSEIHFPTREGIL